MNKRALQALRESLHPGQPIDELQWLTLFSILDYIAEGYDIRERYGIRPKTGRHPKTAGLQKWIVLHFLALCAAETSTAPKDHRGTVAIAWGITDNAVRKLVDKHRVKMRPLIATIGLDAIFASVPILQPEYRRLTPNTR